MNILTKVGKYVALSAIGLLAAFTGNQRTVALTTVDDPDNYLTEEYDGVARLFGPPVYTCGATVLGTGRHLLTAGHCLESYTTSELFLDFGNNLILNPSKLTIHPDPFFHDIGIIHLAEELPADIPRYEINRDSDEFGKVGDKVGYGGRATGDEGVSGEDASVFDSRKRLGQNVYEAGAEIVNQFLPPDFGFIPGTMLLYDFDNGKPENDALGELFGLVDLGLGDNEVNSALGDSGSPTFIDGKIAGLVSNGFGGDVIEDLQLTDVTPLITDSSFGEISFDTRVSYYADWIDRVTVPEPSALVGLLSVVGAGLVLKRKKPDRSCK